MKYIFHERTVFCQIRKLLLIMRLTLLLLVVFVLEGRARGTAQTVTLSVTKMSIEKVCKEIEKQTGYYFVYTKDLNKGNHLITATILHANIEDALQQIFQGLPFSWQLIDKTVVVNTVDKVKEHAANTNVPAIRIINVQGIVLTDQGQPLSGASVTVKASNKSTLTNAKGEFAIQGIPENSVLVISFIGYGVQQILAREGEIIRTKLSIATNELDATVIKGYYNTSKRLNTGNVSVVKGEDIRKQPVTDPILALEGRVPGLYIEQASGIPGVAAKVRLRGQNSLFNGNDPLYIVDGVPFGASPLTTRDVGLNAFYSGEAGQGGGSPFNVLNPSDIESIEVLKDADATAIYGSRGANGVILINTRKGKAGNTHVDLNVFTGANKVTRTLKVLNTQEYLGMRREALHNDGFAPDPNKDYDLVFWDTTRYTDWQKVLIGNSSHFTNAQLGLSGGNENTQFLIGGGYSKQNNVFPGNFANKTASGHISISHSSKDHLFHVQFSGSFANNNNNVPAQDLTNIAITLAPDAPALYNPDGSLNFQLKKSNNVFTFANPLQYTIITSTAVTANLNSNLLLSYQLLPGLTLKSSFGYNKGHADQNLLTPISSLPPPYNANPAARTDNISSAERKTWIIEPQVSYTASLKFGRLDIQAGSTLQENRSQALTVSTSGYASDALLSSPIAASAVHISSSTTSLYHYTAIFGRIGYSWKEKYLLNLTGRRDGSSRFGPGKQFGNFGAIGAGWIFTNEGFVNKNLTWLSFGKLRSSIGVTGNDQISDYAFLSTYNPNISGISYQGNFNTLAPTALTNPYFAWERVKKLEGGIEFGIFKDRFLFSANYFRNRGDNQLVGYVLPDIAGFPTVTANLPAAVQNSGWEFTGTSKNVSTPGFSWSTTINISFPKNKLLSFPDLQNTPYQYSFFPGRSLNTTLVYHYTGVNPQTGAYQVASKTNPGSPSFPGDMILSRPITQSYYGGISNFFTYKGLELDVFVQFVKQLGTGVSYTSLAGSVNYNQPVDILQRWQKPGDQSNVQKFTTSASLSNNYGRFTSSDAFIQDASFIRLKNLSISYHLPVSVGRKMHLQESRIYIQCQNLLTITPYRGLDPETRGLSLPPLRVITAGIQLTL